MSEIPTNVAARYLVFDLVALNPHKTKSELRMLFREQWLGEELGKGATVFGVALFELCQQHVVESLPNPTHPKRPRVYVLGEKMSSRLVEPRYTRTFRSPVRE